MARLGRIIPVLFTAVVGAALLLTAGAPARAACKLCDVGKGCDVPDKTAAQDVGRRIFGLAGGGALRSGMVSYRTMLRELGRADVVFLGEQHDDPNTHLMELDILQHLLGETEGWIVLSLEMFERDVQEHLDAYLAGDLSEEEFLELSRPWPNYETDYRPLVEFCRERRIPVIASNIPRPLASRVAKEGFQAAWDGLSADERRWVAESTTHPKDAYWELFNLTMGGGHGGMELTEDQVMSFYAAQCIKDDTMAESIARLREAEVTVVHVNGSFHSDYHLGTAERVAALRPDDRIVTIALRPANAWETLDPREEDFAPGGDEPYVSAALAPVLPVADYLLYVEGPGLRGADAVPDGEEQPAAEEGEDEMPAMPPLPAG